MAKEPDVTYSRIPEDAAKRWRVVRDVIAGDQALRCDDYLPCLNRNDRSEQNLERNRAYRQRAVLYTATSFTLAGMLGLAFRHDPKSDLPPRLQYLLKDADGAGVSIYQQSQAALARVLGIGRDGLYTDFSSALKRPVIKRYRAEDIINWRPAIVGGKTVTTLVVLREDAEKEIGYGVECVDQWRELRLTPAGVTVKLWQLDENGEPQIVPVEDAEGRFVPEVILRSSGAPLDEIPFDFIGSQNNDATIDDSPLYGLAMVNVAHFRNSADYEDSAFFVGQAQPWIAGLDVEWRDHLEKQGTLYIGSRAPLLLPEKGSFGFAQAAPNMLAMEAMTHKQELMLALGARVLQPGTVAKTATQATGEREASTSILALCVSNTTEAYQRAIRRCARYLDLVLPADAELYEINQDFASVANDAPTITALVGAWQHGLLAKSDVRGHFRRQGTIDPERTDEDIDAEIVLVPPPADSLPGAKDNTAALLKAPAEPAAIAPPAPLDLSPIVSAILGAKPEPLDLDALVALVKAGQTEPQQPVDMAPVADAMRAGMEAVSAAVAAIGAAVAAIQPQAAPNITVPVQVDAPAPIDMSALAEALKANGEAMAAALGAIKPALTLVQQRSNSATIREADGSETLVTLN